MIPAAMPNGGRLRLGVHDAITIHQVSYRIIEDMREGYVLQNLETGLHEGFDNARLVSLSNEGHLEFSAGHYSSVAARTRLDVGASSVAALPTADQQEIARRLGYITRFVQRRADEHLANAGKPRRERIKPSISSREGMEAALVKIHEEMLALEAARLQPLSEDGPPKKPRKPRSGSQAPPSDNGPGYRTFKAWLNAYETSASSPLALRPKTMRCGNRQPRFEPEVERLLQEHAASFASEKKPTRESCHKRLRAALSDLNANRKDAGLKPYPVPSDRTLCQRIAALDMFLVESKRLGVEAATRKHRFIVGRAEAIRPGQRVEMDEWKVDLFFLLSQTDLLKGLSEEELADLRKKRWALCVAIDVATRCILGLRLDRTASVRNAIATLEMVVSDKRPLADAVGAHTLHSLAARPEDVSTDTGSSFYDKDFHLAVIRLGSGHDLPPAGMPHLRGTIERLFRTLSLQLVREFTGQTFENKVAKGEYPAMARASLTVEDFALAAVRYAVDVYHNLPHEGLGGETPANAWRRLTDLYGVIPIPGRNERRAIFGLRVERVLGRHGLRFMGLDYRAAILRDLYLKRGGIPVPIRIDPQDIGAISVEIDGTWHEVRAATHGFDGVTLADHQALCQQLAKRFADQAQLSEGVVFEALRAIQDRASAAERAATFLTKFAEPADIERAERNLRSFTIPSSLEGDGSPPTHPLADIIPTGGSTTTAQSPDVEPSSSKSPARKPRRPSLGVEPDAVKRPALRKRHGGMSLDD